MGAARDAVQLGLLLAFFAIGVQWMRNTDGGQQFLFATRQYILELLSPEHKTLRGTTTKASSPGEALQPEAVRKAAPAVRPEGHEMKCNEEIPAYSSVTSNKIQIFAQGFYKGKVHDSDEHWWMYRIEFKNTGRQRVQLLTRHWLFVDANGKTTEVKGPGARGMTPKLGPGRSHSYESGTPLKTDRGSMYGSFQFQILKYEDGSKPLRPHMFSARVGRLALSPDNAPITVPCGEETPEGMVALTSVFVTDRVIVGVTSSFQQSISPDKADAAAQARFGELALSEAVRRKGGGQAMRFIVDVQVNNGRDQTVNVKRVLWHVSDGLAPAITAEREGVMSIGQNGSPRKPVAYTLGQNEALRYEDYIDIATRTAIVEGEMIVEIDPEDDDDGDGLLHVFIAPFALNVEGEPIPDPNH